FLSIGNNLIYTRYKQPEKKTHRNTTFKHSIKGRIHSPDTIEDGSTNTPYPRQGGGCGTGCYTEQSLARAVHIQCGKRHFDGDDQTLVCLHKRHAQMDGN